MPKSRLDAVKADTAILCKHMKEIFRLDDESRSKLWEAYCGNFDPKKEGSLEAATKLGVELQQGEKGVLEAARAMMQELIGDLQEIEEDLIDLENGVVLQGSNHPVIQTCIEYGKKMHDEYGATVGEEPRIYDQEFPGVDGRPDLVTIEDEKFVIYEFKPNNQAAMEEGVEQLERYVPGVVAYFEEFFEDGCNKGFTDKSPSSDHKGRAFLKKLKNARDAWSPDGSHLVPVYQVLTYNMCDRNLFDE